MRHRPQVNRVSRRALAGLAAVLGVIAIGLGAFPGLSQAALPDGGFSAKRFGVVEAYYRPDDARDLGVGWERIVFEWAQFQPQSPDEFHTEVIPDDWLIAAQQAGREVVGLLKNTPRWASASHQLGAPPDGLDLPLDDPGNVWAQFVQRVVAYYGERWGVTHWIIYNEPDIRPGELGSIYEFDGDVEDYYRVLKVAYQAAKRANPDTVIHLAGMAWWTDVLAGRRPYLERLLTVAARDPEARANGYFFDVATVHVYFKTINVWNMIVETEGILWHFDLRDKPMWVDETNAAPSRDPGVVLPPDPIYDESLTQQSAFIVQAAALSLAANVERFAVYRLYDDHFVSGQTEPWGLVRADGSRRPAFDAYRTVIETFAGTTHAQRLWSERSSLVTLEQPERTVYVMWARSSDPVRFYVRASNAAETAQRIALDGSTETTIAGTEAGADGAWFVVDTAGALPDDSGAIVTEGVPVLLAVEGPPRQVWVDIAGSTWTLR